MAETNLKPSFTFPAKPPAEVSAYFKNKGLKPAFSWQDVWGQEHAHAFTVAKATKVELLSQMKGALQKAIDEGQTLEQFKKGLIPELQKQGWWGKKLVQDPLTGKQVLSQLGSHRRLKTIFEANMRAARSAGQWQRIERTKAVLPYLEYRLGASEKHRPHHTALAGTVLPVDHDFWKTHFTPNGWGCKCWIKQITRRAAEAQGISDAPKIEHKPFVNKRTGEITQVPVGIDAGWHTNSGQLRAQNLMDNFHARLLDAPDLAEVALKDMRTNMKQLLRDDMAALYEQSAYKATPDEISEIITTERAKQRIMSSLPKEAQRAIGEQVDGGLVLMRPSRVKHLLHHAPNSGKKAAGKVVSKDQAIRLFEIMEQPEAVYEILDNNADLRRFMVTFEDNNTGRLLRTVLEAKSISPRQASGKRISQKVWDLLSISVGKGDHLSDAKRYKALWKK